MQQNHPISALSECHSEVDTAEKTTIQELGWFDLRDTSRWDPLAINDPLTRSKLNGMRQALGYVTESETHETALNQSDQVTR